MKRNVKNDKVLKAITIGLAAMIAATSVPMDVYALDETEATEPDGVGDVEEDSSEQQAEEVHEEVREANECAETLVPSNPASADGAVASDEIPAPEGSIPAAVIAVGGLLVDSAEGQTAQLPGVTNALGQLGVAADYVGEVKGDLLTIDAVVATGGELGATPIETVYSVEPVTPADGDNAEASVEKATETVSIPVLHTSETEEYYKNDEKPADVDYYDETAENRSEFYDSAKDEKPFIKSIVADYNDAVDSFKKYEADNTDQQSLADAFDAAAEADRKLTIEENKIKALDEAIKDSKAAEEALKKAREELETVQTIKSKYDTMMKQYFGNLITDIHNKSVTNEDGSKTKLVNSDGSINAQACVTYLNNDNNNNLSSSRRYDEKGKSKFENTINWKADNPDKHNGALTTSARALFCELVKAHIEEELGGTEVKFLMKSGNEVSKDEIQSVMNLNKDTSEALPGGRNHRFTVTYKLNGEEKTECYNYVYKSNKVDSINGESVPRGDKLDIENGIFYLARIEKETIDGKVVWVHDVNTRYDDYNLYASKKAINDAVKAVKAAEEKSATLKSAVNSIRNKILGVNPDEYDEEALDNMFADLKVSAKYSRVKLNALRELIGERPVINNGGGEETTGGGDEDPGTGGGTYDLGTGTLVLPGYEIPPITLPTTPSGVAGVRAAASRPTGVLGVKAPETKAEKTIANKTVVKPAAKKTVAQKGKKIADPETPLAATPFVDEDGMKIPWIWLLIIAALGAVGKKMYDEHKKKVQAEEEAKKYND